VIGVLGNHDYECGQPEVVTEILHGAGMTVLDEQAIEIKGVGFAGVKGFMGGYGRGELAPFGEPIAKMFVDEAMNEARKLENGLRSLRTERSVAVLHYSPIAETLEGEPIEIFQYLGSARLADAIDRFDHVKAVVHGHAHHGTYEGQTVRGTPVYNVAQFVVREQFKRPYALLEI
jgi:Icc-related predicted phosphoesterase